MHQILFCVWLFHSVKSKIHVCFCVYQLPVLFHCCIEFPCVTLSLFTHSTVDKLLLVFGYKKYNLSINLLKRHFSSIFGQQFNFVVM